MRCFILRTFAGAVELVPVRSLYLPREDVDELQREIPSRCPPVRGSPVGRDEMQCDDLYVGRGTNLLTRSNWHSPFVCNRYGTRSQVLRKFQKYLRSNASLWSSLHELDGKRLRCHCSAHLDCHVDVLIRAWSEKNNVQNSGNEVICGLVTQKQHVFEIFCGHFGVASAGNDLGQLARAVDWHVNKFKPVFPVFNMDLTQRSQQECLLRDLDVGCPTFVWMSPPCASALSASDESLAWKLERDDTLNQYCAQLWEWCRGKGIQVAIENPRASRLWASPVWLRLCAAPGTFEIALQQCMFGASRDKWSKIVSTSDKLAPSPKLATSHMYTNIGRRRTSRGLYAARVVAAQSDCAKRSQRAFVDNMVDKVHVALSHNQMTFLRLSASSIAQHQSDWCQSSRRCYSCLVVFSRTVSPME